MFQIVETGIKGGGKHKDVPNESLGAAAFP